MVDYNFYSAILGLSSDWQIVNVSVDAASGYTELHIRGREESAYSCPSCGSRRLPDRFNRIRALHESGHNIRFIISAKVPIVSCTECGEFKVALPWDRVGKQSESPVSDYSHHSP